MYKENKEKSTYIVGMDLGVKKLVTLSNGISYDNKWQKNHLSKSINNTCFNEIITQLLYKCSNCYLEIGRI